MHWLLIVLTVFLILDALRLRRRLGAFKEAVADSGVRAHQTYHLIVAPGVVVDAATAQLASAYAQTHGIEVLDLIPRDLPSLAAIRLARDIEPSHYRTECFGRGYTAGYALLIHDDVLRRAGATDRMPADPVAFVRLASKLKRYACTSMDLAIMPGLRATQENPDYHLAVLREKFEPFSSVLGAAIVGQLVIIIVLVLAIIKSPWWGLLALATYHAQPLMILGRQRKIRPFDLLLVTFCRSPMELWRWMRTILRWWYQPPEPDPVEAKRPEYEKLAAGGLAQFFEPRRETCPLCSGSDLRPHLSTPDMLGYKPGCFHLECCGSCGHIFQNPRLSIAGLDYHYRDCYDGLGQKFVELMYDLDINSYLSRARMLTGRKEPVRWLDVGTGYGHFCCAARQVWPRTTFDGLDFSTGIDEGVRRRWIDTGYRGLFPEVAPQLTATYDVVSMSHYLEHTRDPQAEIKAARQVLTHEGYLLIEVPDPECYLGQLLGRFWILWFQPQHQHCLSVANLERLLHQYGFEPVVWHRGEAHMPCDIGISAILLLGRLMPNHNVPWRRPPSRLERLGNVLVIVLGMPLILIGRILDRVLAPMFRRPGLANAYRVLAQRCKDETA